MKINTFIKQTKNKIRIFFYKNIYDIEIKWDCSMLPQLGKGKFVSVYRKGSYIDIVDEKTQNKE